MASEDVVICDTCGKREVFRRGRAGFAVLAGWRAFELELKAHPLGALKQALETESKDLHACSDNCARPLLSKRIEEAFAELAAREKVVLEALGKTR